MSQESSPLATALLAVAAAVVIGAFASDARAQVQLSGKKLGKSPTGPALASVSNVILPGGGVAIRSGDETLAALGVGGSAGGALDEQCALSGAAEIRERVDALAVSKP